MRQLLIASQNPGKLREIKALLADVGLPLVEPSSIGLELRIEESGTDYAANAALKATAFAQASSLWSLADDSGLEVDALGGAPGLYSARLAADVENGIAVPSHSDAERRRALLRLLSPHPRPWKARFRCTVALASPSGSLDLAEGICPGEIIAVERGAGGFGYDPLFLVAGTRHTMAELSLEEKNCLSHRARAIHALIPVLKERLGL